MGSVRKPGQESKRYFRRRAAGREAVCALLPVYVSDNFTFLLLPVSASRERNPAHRGGPKTIQSNQKRCRNQPKSGRFGVSKVACSA